MVHTSPDGGCHLWLRLTHALDEHHRYLAQRWLIPKVNADLGSVSGEHLGRLAGTRNWKRASVWVNVVNDALIEAFLDHIGGQKCDDRSAFDGITR